MKLKWRVRHTFTHGYKWTYLKQPDGSKRHVRFATREEAEQAAENWYKSDCEAWFGHRKIDGIYEVTDK